VGGRKDHDGKAVLSFIRDFNGPPAKIDRAIREKRNKSHHLTSEANRCGMCRGYIAEISTDAIVKIFIGSG
jgi:hypothetical protein